MEYRAPYFLYFELPTNGILTTLPMEYQTHLVLYSESSKTAMKYWIPLPWYIEHPTHGISKPYPWYFDSLPIEYQTPPVLNGELSNTAIEYLLPSMVYWTPCL
jgi:hypothetical protein